MPEPRGTAHTVNMGRQMLKPAEIAYAHRHTMAAPRFAMVTLVGGEPCQMDDHDLALTPSWSWNDRENATSENVADAVLFPGNEIPPLRGVDLYYQEPESSLSNHTLIVRHLQTCVVARGTCWAGMKHPRHDKRQRDKYGFSKRKRTW